MERLKIILLDLGGVVFQSTGESNDRIDWKIITKLNHKYGHRLNVGEIGIDKFLEEYNLLTGQKLDSNTFLMEVFNTLHINESLINFVSRFGRIVIVSDNYRENIQYISERYRFSEWSEKGIYSYEYKMVKSNPHFFGKLVYDLFPIIPEEMLLIDDSMENIINASNQGITGIRYVNNDQVRIEMNKIYP